MPAGAVLSFSLGCTPLRIEIIVEKTVAAQPNGVYVWDGERRAGQGKE